MSDGNIEGYGPFRKMDKQSVTGFLKATGTRDPDILLLKKQALLQPNRLFKRAGIGFVIFSGLFTLIMTSFSVVAAAILGGPLILASVYVWRLAKGNIAVVEAAYNEYVGSGGNPG